LNQRSERPLAAESPARGLRAGVASTHWDRRVYQADGNDLSLYCACRPV